jgi:hypothetical protein
MGYFRFRRSFKILPGVRWNIGKKSSSVSLGGRGFHYTIGSAGGRTTVGLPGTGFSYTSVTRRKRAERIPDHDVDKALEWSKAQEETFQLHIPDRKPGEPPATPGQIATIHDLVRSISDSDLTDLGSNQAEFLIQEIKLEKDRFNERKVHEYLDQNGHGSSGGCLFLLIGGLILIGYVFFKANH